MAGRPSELKYVETPLLDQLKKLGWTVVQLDDSEKHDPQKSFRESFSEVVIVSRLKAALKRLNPWLNDVQIDDLCRQIQDYPHPLKQILENNEEVYDRITEGLSADNEETGEVNCPVRLIDWTDVDGYDGPDATDNDFLAISQYKVRIPGKEEHIIPDVILFVNGLPLVVIECKAPDITEPMAEGIDQLMRYQNRRGAEEPEGVPELFYFNQIVISTCFHDCRYSSITGGVSHFMEWKDAYPYKLRDVNPNGKPSAQEITVAGMLEPSHLLDIIQNFIAYKDEDNGVRVKLVPRYMQYRGASKIIERLRNADSGEKGGTLWHTQGTGKTLTMMFVIRKMYNSYDLNNYKVVLIVDRKDLQTQMFKTTKTVKYAINIAGSIDGLKDLIKNTASDVTVAMVHKFGESEKNKEKKDKKKSGSLEQRTSVSTFPVLNTSDRILVMIDEAHRSEYSELAANMWKSMPNSVKVAFLDNYERNAPYTSFLYTTHSHTAGNPRVRLIFPLTRDITSEEFVAVSRYLAQMLGIDYFDECSYQPNQLMYWPSSPQNGVFVYKEVEKDWLNPDDILSAHPEWTDPTRLPTSSRESKANQILQQKVQDPLTKDGVVGLFNRVFFPVSKALDTFLSDVYEPTDNENRYHLIESSSMAGVEIKDDKFVYSHHAKDPAYLKLCNAFDIVRIHKFSDMDDKASFQAMCDFAMQVDDVRLLAANERLAGAEADFTAIGDDDWKKRLKFQPRTSLLENSVYNLNLILANDPDFQNFAYNEMANRIQVMGPLPWERPEGNLFWRDADTAQLKSVIDIRYLPFSSRNHDVAFIKTADDRHFHPVRDYLDSLPAWDGIERVEDLFIRYLKADDTEYVRTVTRKTFAAAVARVYVPGTKFDCVPVLDGDQGIGKSTIVKDLVTPDYYSETLSLTDMDDKSGAEKLQGFWVMEIGELAGMKKADIEKVKAFLSTSDDKYRPSYGILLKMITHLSSFRGDSSFTTWVFSIAANHLKNYK